MRFIGCLLVLVLGLFIPTFTYGQSVSAQSPTNSVLESETNAEVPVAMMTTLEPIELANNEKLSCTSYCNCEDCFLFNCTWVQCLNTETFCLDSTAEMCPEISCSATEEPSNSTTTPAPTTTNDTTTETTANPNGTTTIPPTTESPTPTETPTDVPVTATTTTGTTPTLAPAPTPTPTPTPSHERHFDATSFMGGMILALALTGVCFAGYKYYHYRRRSLATTYSNF